MTYTFKLSRRLARLRDATVIATSLFTVSCTGDPNGPGSTPPATDPISVVIAPDSISVGANQTVQFQAATDTSGGLSFNVASARGRGRKKVVDVALSPVSSSMVPGGSLSFNATATLNDGSTVERSLAWTATGGTVDSSGKYTAGQATGKYRVIAAAANGVADTAAVSITTIAPILAQIVLSPASISLPAGGSQQFTAEGKSADSATVSVTPTYNATGGTISPAGVYTAGQTPGTFRVIATDTATGLADTAGVTIPAPGVTLESVVLIPATASVAQGAKQQFSASGRMSDGSTVPLSPSFTATGGSISSSGEYTAGSTAGTYRVIATDTASGNADTSSVTITAPPTTLQAVVLTPTTISLTAGATQQFTASGKMSDGSTSAVTVAWSASGGTISSAGFYTAGSVAGSYRVIATQTGGTLADTSAVTTTTPDTPPSAPPAGGLPTPLRTVNVATTTALNTALQAALPGDRIVMAAGSYTFSSAITRSGTATNPIVLTGPGTAVLTGRELAVKASYWIFNGFRMTNTTGSAISHYAGNYNIYEYLELDHTGVVGIAIKTGLPGVDNGTTVTGNIIRYNHIHHTGLGGTTAYGEGVYLGDGSCGCQVVTGTHIHHNNIHDITAEGIDVKAGTRGAIIEFNTLTNTGTAAIVGSRDPIHIGGNSNQVRDNAITKWPGSAAISTGNGGNFPVATNANNNTYRRNTGTNAVGGNLFKFEAGHSGNVVYCDNNPVAPTVLGVTCTR